ncbi:MAG TPA: hypothetical protein PKK80_02485 [Bacilli bacterium]|nr:hypothetical protein [Bacilli bacterium]
MTLPEQENKIPVTKRKEIIKALANTKTGQALREEFVDIMNDVGNVNKLQEYLFDKDNELASEVRGMRRAKAYIQGVYNMLIPEEEKKETKKAHK